LCEVDLEVDDGVDAGEDHEHDEADDEEGHRRLFEGYLREYEAEGLA
jgi:hypothetical protein